MAANPCASIAVALALICSGCAVPTEPAATGAPPRLGAASTSPSVPRAPSSSAATPLPTSATAPAAVGATASSAPSAPPIVPYDVAVAQAATALFTAGQQALGTQRRVLLIDPLIDGASAMQTMQTQNLEATLVAMVRQRFAQFEPRPFDAAQLAASPVVLIGTFTAVNNAGANDAERDAYRLCLALADLASGRIIAKGTARASPAGVDATPLPADRDAPLWLKDPQVDGYIRSCQGTRAGDAIDAKYLDAMQAAALVASAARHYKDGRWRAALQDYRSARALPGGAQTRVFNGLYLSQLRLGHLDAAEQAFGELVDHGLAAGRLPMMFIFRTGSIDLVAEGRPPTPYGMWARQIAAKARRTDACLEVTGHASRGGPAALNERLSQLRADAIRQRLIDVAPAIAPRTIARGVGARMNIVGTGANDFSDAPDRRVELVSVRC